MRLEQSMQSKIKVYESSRGEKEPSGKQELPPELQAMVDGDKRYCPFLLCFVLLFNFRPTERDQHPLPAEVAAVRFLFRKIGQAEIEVQNDSLFFFDLHQLGFEHRRRPRDLDDAVIHINAGGEDGILQNATLNHF